MQHASDVTSRHWYAIQKPKTRAALSKQSHRAFVMLITPDTGYIKLHSIHKNRKSLFLPVSNANDDETTIFSSDRNFAFTLLHIKLCISHGCDSANP